MSEPEPDLYARVDISFSYKIDGTHPDILPDYDLEQVQEKFKKDIEHWVNEELPIGEDGFLILHKSITTYLDTEPYL